MLVNIKIIASDALAPDTILLVSPGLSPEGEIEARRRIRFGEDEQKVMAEIMVRERRAVAIKVRP